jgi:hypothetical protein
MGTTVSRKVTVDEDERGLTAHVDYAPLKPNDPTFQRLHPAPVLHEYQQATHYSQPVVEPYHMGGGDPGQGGGGYSDGGHPSHDHHGHSYGGDHGPNDATYAQQTAYNNQKEFFNSIQSLYVFCCASRT